jgi:hypothetical protein
MPTKDLDARRRQWRAWYERNKDNPTHKRRVRDFDRRRRRELAAWLEHLKVGLRCRKCGFDHPAALDFHHRKAEDKLYEVSTMPLRSISKQKILAEIAKCDVYCANCHRILHYERRKGSIV